MKTFDFYKDEKHTIWVRTNFSVQAENYEQALEKIKERLRSHYNDLIRLFSENLTKESKIQILSHNYAQLLFSYNL